MYLLIESVAGKSNIVDKGITAPVSASVWATECLQFNGTGYNVLADNGDTCTINIAGYHYQYRVVDTDKNDIAKALYIIGQSRSIELTTPNGTRRLTPADAHRAVWHATQCRDCVGGETSCVECAGYDSTDISVSCDRIYLDTDKTAFLTLYFGNVGFAMSQL